MNDIRRSEEEQRKLFISLFYSTDERLFCEVPVFSRSIDVVKYNMKTGLITAIEFKIDNWKRAIKQALSVGISFDYLEICIPKPKLFKTQENIMRECQQQGIGLYFFDTETLKFHKVIEPIKVQNIWETQKSQVIKYVGGLTE